MFELNLVEKIQTFFQLKSIDDILVENSKNALGVSLMNSNEFKGLYKSELDIIKKSYVEAAAANVEKQSSELESSVSPVRVMESKSEKTNLALRKDEVSKPQDLDVSSPNTGFVGSINKASSHQPSVGTQ